MSNTWGKFSAHSEKVVEYWKKFRETLLFNILLIIVGIVISLIFTSQIAGILIDFQMAGVDPVQEPVIDASVEKIDVSYKNGQPIREFDELKWQEGYELYRVSVSNPGPRAVENINSNLQLPGCIVGYRKEQLARNVFVETNEDIYVTQGNASLQITQCDRELVITTLPSGETASITLIIRKFDSPSSIQASDAILFDREISRTVSFEYEWEWKSHSETNETPIQVKGANQSYVDAYLYFGRFAASNNKTENAAAYFQEAYRIAPNDPEVMREFGFAIAKYGFEHDNLDQLIEGRDLIKESIEKNSSNPVGWYYRAAAETFIAVTVNDSRQTKIHYCLAKASITKATRDGRLIPPARSLERELNEHSPNVNCNINRQLYQANGVFRNNRGIERRFGH